MAFALSWVVIGAAILLWLIIYRLPQHSYMQSRGELVLQVSAVTLGVCLIFNGMRMSRSSKS
jgi:hypothetical protein